LGTLSKDVRMVFRVLGHHFLFNRDFPIELNFYWKPLENHHDFIEV
jgi:hypothetical protein